MRKRKFRRKSTISNVLVDEFRDLDAALKWMRKGALKLRREWNFRPFFFPKPTHSARKRRGNLLESRKAKFLAKEEQEAQP